jgi:hypothetical protein
LSATLELTGGKQTVSWVPPLTLLDRSEAVSWLPPSTLLDDRQVDS